MAFRIAEAVGCTVAELEGRMTVREFTGWLARFMIEDEEQKKALDKSKGKPAPGGKKGGIRIGGKKKRRPT